MRFILLLAIAFQLAAPVAYAVDLNAFTLLPQSFNALWFPIYLLIAVLLGWWYFRSRKKKLEEDEEENGEDVLKKGQ